VQETRTKINKINVKIINILLFLLHTNAADDLLGQEQERQEQEQLNESL